VPYDLEEHRHRFSVWAAARAAQRGLTSVDILREALERCGIRDFLNPANLNDVDDGKFREQHEKWCGSIVGFLKKKRVSKTTYGRAAKMVAVYLKSMIVLGPQTQSSLSQVAYPPIDGRLLRNISQAGDVTCPDKDGLGKVKWTKLNRKDYYKLVERLRKCLPHGHPFWKLERF